VPISNCLNSGFNRIFVVTQFLSVSLHRHIANTYKFDPFGRGFVEVLAAQQTNEAADWYEGTADALRQNLASLNDPSVRDILVLSGDQLYRMDFRALLQEHRASGADVTIAAAAATPARAAGLGVLSLRPDQRVVGLVEKPSQPDQLERLRTPADWLHSRGVVAEGREHLVNMGIYVFRRQALLELLAERPEADDLVREILVGVLDRRPIFAHLFGGYWDDLGTIAWYYEAHMALVGERTPFDFHSPEGVIYTHMRNLPAARVSDAQVEQALISDGCIVREGARLRRCVIGLRGRIGAGASLSDTVMLGVNAYESPAQLAENRRARLPDVGVGDGAVVERAILDKGCRIGRGARIVNARGLRDADGGNFVVRDGIVVIPRGAVVPDGAVI
jgi:glucose-1-phosphate adenylyltransferase